MTVSWPAAHKLLGSETALITGLLNAFSDPLTDFSASFTITASTTNPTKGNSTYMAKYLTYGKLLWFSAKVTIGSTFSAGSGDYSFLVPAALDTTIAQVLPCLITDAGTANRVCQARPVDSTHLLIFRPDQVSPVGSSGPGTAWGTGDGVDLSGWLRLA